MTNEQKFAYQDLKGHIVSLHYNPQTRRRYGFVSVPQFETNVYFSLEACRGLFLALRVEDEIVCRVDYSGDGKRAVYDMRRAF